MIIGYSRVFGAAAPAPTLVQAVRVLQSSSAANTYTASTDITVGSGTNRAVLVIIDYVVSADSTDTTSISATLEGVAMTKLFGVAETSGRPRAAAFGIVAPASGASTVVVSNVTNGAAAIIWAIEVTGANQTLGNWISNGARATGVTSRATGVTTTVSNCLLLRGLIILSGNYSSEITATGGATLQNTGSTGTTGFSDCTSGLASKVLGSAGTDTSGFSWTTSQEAADLGVAIPPV